MTTRSPNRRLPAVGAATLIAVLLLFGTLTFVAGLAVGSGDTGALADASPSAAPSGSAASPDGTPEATPRLETITCAEPAEAFGALCEAYAQIKGEYVDPVIDEDLVDGAIRGMVEFGLGDPYSGYLPQEQYGSALDDLSGEFSGIGAEVGMENVANPDDLASCTVVTETCALVIVAPLAGSPAEEAGLRAGDRVLEIDGESTIGESVSSLVFRVRGEAGTEVTLTVERDARQLDVAITRAVIDLREVDSRMLQDRIGYIRLTTFTDRATGLFREGLGSLLEQGATSIVFDLRGNPGGFITTAQGIASQFVPAGELLFTVESGDEVQRWESDPGGLAQTDAVQVILLVDEGSASASEIVAGALKETGRATLVGEPTFGKNTVQIWNDLPNGGGLRITTDRWFTPLHNSAAPDGIQPDAVVPSPEDPTSGQDPQLDRAVELLIGG